MSFELKLFWDGRQLRKQGNKFPFSSILCIKELTRGWLWPNILYQGFILHFRFYVSGRRAVDALVADGRRLARQIPASEQQEVEETITEAQMLTEQLATLKAKGKGNSPEAQEVTEKLKTALSKLKVQLQSGAIHGVINVFKEIGHGQALKQLEKAARASPGLTF